MLKPDWLPLSTRPDEFFGHNNYDSLGLQASHELAALTSQSHLQSLLQTVSALVRYTDQFQHILVSGRSRLLPIFLLSIFGVSSQRIVQLDEAIDTVLYDNVGQRDLAERTALLEHRLRSGGVFGNRLPSICFVEEVMMGGMKTGAFHELLSGVAGLHKFSIAVLSSEQKLHRDESGMFRALLGDQFSCFIAEQETDELAPTELFRLIDTMATLSSLINWRERMPEERLSPDVFRTLLSAHALTLCKIRTIVTALN